MNFYQRSGELIFGTRLKRLSDRFLADIAKTYKSLNIEFEPSWFPFFYLLNEQKSLSVTEIADILQITHPAVSQFLTTLEKKKLVSYTQDDSDKRKRFISLTEAGHSLLVQVLPVWNSIIAAMRDLFGEGQNSAYLLQAIDELEKAIEKRGFQERIIQKVQNRQLDEIQIIPYEHQYKPEFKSLMLSWLLENYQDDVLNVDLINYPEKKIIDNGGLIQLVKAADEIIGTVVVETNGDQNAQILYLVIHEGWRNKTIGGKLLSETLALLRGMAIRDVRVCLDRKFARAIMLFRRAGFQPLNENGHHEGHVCTLELGYRFTEN